jgi:hypothetical protein
MNSEGSPFFPPRFLRVLPIDRRADLVLECFYTVKRNRRKTECDEKPAELRGHRTRR